MKKYTLKLQRSKNHNLLFKSTLLFFVLTVLVSIGCVYQNLNLLGGLGVLLMSYLIAVPLIVDRRLRNDPFNAYSFFILKYQIGYFLIPTILGLILGFQKPGLDLSNLGQAGILSGATFFFVYVGYISNIGDKLSSSLPLYTFPKGRVSFRYIMGTAIVLYILGWLGRLQEISLGITHFSKSTEALQITSLLGPTDTLASLSFLTMVWVSLKTNGKFTLSTLIAISAIVLEVIHGALQGSRSRIILPLIYTGIVYHKTVSKLYWKSVIIGILAVFLVVAPMSYVYRTSFIKNLRQSKSESLTSVSAEAANFDTFVKSFGPQKYPLLLKGLQARTSALIDGTLQVVDQVPDDVPYQKGATFFPGAIVNLAPRFLWPDKPVYKPGQINARKFWNKTSDTSMGIGLPAELYYNFSWLGVFFAPVLGIIVRFFHHRYLILADYEYLSIIRYFFVINIALPDTYLVYLPASIMSTFAVYYLFLIVVNKGLPVRVRGNNS